MRGKLIAFEGGEGSGKTTTILEVLKYFQDKGVIIESFREPGGLESSEDIRRVILGHDIEPITEAMLFAASRAELMKKRIIPLLESGVNVLLDRGVMSSLCYQGFCGGLGIDNVFAINKYAIGDYMPDLVVLLDIDPEIGLNRVLTGDREINRIDKKSLVFHKKVRAGYLHLSKRFNTIFTTINANDTPSNVFEKSLSEILKIIPDKVNTFRGNYFPLSNFYPKKVTYKNVRFENNEAAFQAMKCQDPKDYALFSSLDPSQAKWKGRKVALRPDWEDVKEQFMYEICLAKFTQNKKLGELLLQTGNMHLEEGNDWGDKTWGTVNGIGGNKLGIILMRVREDLKNEKNQIAV